MPERTLFPVPEAHPYNHNGNGHIAKPPTLKQLAEQIANLHQAIQGLMLSTLERAHQCGKLLLEAKERAAYGTFEKWVEDSCPFKPRMARRYMQIATTIPDITEFLRSKRYCSTVLEAAAIGKEIARDIAPDQEPAEPLPPEEQEKIKTYVNENALEGICELMQAGKIALEDAQRVARLDDRTQRRLVTVLSNLDKVPDARMVTTLINEANEEVEEVEDGPVLDMLEQEVPRKLREVFSDTTLLDFVKDLQGFFRTLKKDRNRFFFCHRAEFWRAIGQLEEQVAQSLPHSLCRTCRGRGRAKGEECRRCLGQGYVSRGIYEDEQLKEEPSWEDVK
jgi:DUF3102 family protein